MKRVFQAPLSDPQADEYGLVDPRGNGRPSSRGKDRQERNLGWLVLACALITLIVCVFSWVATFGLLPERALASGESLLAADYRPWEGYRVLNLDVANLATAAAYGDAPWQGQGTPVVVATLPPVTPFEITSQATPLPTLTPVQVTPTRRPVLPRATNTLPPTIPGVTSTSTTAPTAPPPAPTSPPPAPTSPTPAPTATSSPTAQTPTPTVDTPTPTVETPTPTVETPTPTVETPTATNLPGDTTDPMTGTITARGENINPPTYIEGMAQAFDSNVNTKWLDFSPDPTTRASWIQYMYAGTETHVVTQYTIMSANDHPERDPYTWSLFGVDAVGGTTLLDTQTAQSFSGRLVTNTYTMANTTAYRGYLLVIDRVFNPPTATSLQLAEIELIGY